MTSAERLDALLGGGDALLGGGYASLDAQPTAARARWVVLLLFAIASATNQVAWIAFAPVRDETGRAYRVGAGLVDALSIVFMVTYLPLAAPATWLLAERGLRPGVLAGAVLTALGCAVRALSLASERGATGSYRLLLLGQTVASCGQPFLLNAPPVLAAAWFPPSERATADAAASVAATVGSALGMLAPLLFPAVPALLRAEAIGAVSVAALLVLLFPAAPRVPPSVAASSSRLPLRASLAHVLRARGWWPLLAAFALPLGAFNALATLVDGVVSPYGFGPEAASAFGGIVVGAGLAGSAIVATLADRWRAHRPLLRACFGVALPAGVLLPLALRTRAFSAVALAMALVGGSMMPILPLSYELAAECTYPAPEALTAGLLMAAGSVVGIATTLAGGACLAAGQVVPALCANAACIAFGLAGALAFDGDLHRLNAEGDAATATAPVGAGARAAVAPKMGTGDAAVVRASESATKL
ncbi:hypothetical protein KFE25_000223 [Diacronema lutheri]|uniref:Major facilitator superfamily (MFS) profile domain-containing protein n=3 Tax=Diacronema lutheri TaxID=2081491 RepID=A0A8J5XIS2_DIALT|nr:hypothetical protein KFE25_000223 [Diacronema lutheri]